MKKLLESIINLTLISSVALLTSCATYKVPTSKYVLSDKKENLDIRQRAAEHKLYDFIPRHREQIRVYDIPHWTTWILMGNDDDGIFGESYPYLTNINLATACSWQRRNYLHNFCFYTIGSAGREKHSNLKVLSLSDEGIDVFSRKSNVFGKGKFIGLDLSANDEKPFFAFRLLFLKGYFGWRERGNFGIAIRGNEFWKKDKE